MQQRDDQREGFALAAAVLALVVIGALVTGGFYAASQESRVSIATASADRAFYYAERGLHEGLSDYQRSAVDTLPEDTTIVLETTDIFEGGRVVGRYELSLRRLGPRIYFLGSTGEVLEGGRYEGATRTVGMLTRTLNPSFPMNRALQVNGDLTVTGHSKIDGSDNPPDPWAECDSTNTMPGIVAQDSALVDQSGAAEIDGDPPMEEDSTLSLEDYTEFGDVDFDMLASAADIVLPGAKYSQVAPAHDADGACDLSMITNWGAPLDATDVCHPYFPTIYRDGDLHISASSAGQGILLVEGHLKLSGGFEFFGIVIVKGTLESRGTGSHLNGVVLVGGGGLLDPDSTVNNETSTSGNSIINFSSCAALRAEEQNRHTSRLVPVAQRAWVDLSAVGTNGTP